MILTKMKTLERLVKIACYYNRIKNIEFYRDYDKEDQEPETKKRREKE